MSKKKKRVRDEPNMEKRSSGTGAGIICGLDDFETLCCSGYTALSHNPEIIAAINKITDMVSSMTIYLMANSQNGDVRIKNELAKKVDIYPNAYMTRKTFIASIVRTLLLEGDGNAIVLPQYKDGLLTDLVPIDAASVSFIPDGYGYHINISGQPMSAGDILHFVINPDPHYPWRGTGCRASLKEVADNLKQAAATKKGFMESKWKPSMIVKVDGQVEEFASKEGRKKLLEQFVESSEAGQPWMIPAEQFDVVEVRPLSLNDIALADSVKLDKRTVAAVLDVPPFIVGEGSYSEKEWNHFISARIKPICNALEQELTRKLLLNPEWYFKFNVRSLYAYDIKTLSDVGANMYTRGIMTGNEVRDWLSLSPKENLDELVILENYIPAGMIADQKKLQGGENDE